MGREQTFISLIENAQRRVDVVEFFVRARAMGAGPVALLAEIEKRLPRDLSIG